MTCTEIYCLFEKCWKYKTLFSRLLYSKSYQRQTVPQCPGAFPISCAGGRGSAAALLGRDSQALAGLGAGCDAQAGLLYSQAHVQPSLARPIELRGKLVTQLGLCRASSVVPRVWKYEHLQFMCHLPFLFPVYTSEHHNSGIQCHLLWIISEEDRRFDLVEI